MKLDVNWKLPQQEPLLNGCAIVGTAHGRTLNNLLMNPTLSDLIAELNLLHYRMRSKRRGTQKTVLGGALPRLLMCWLR
jgi:stage III sporulation protein SpoIIIAA